MCGFVVTTSKIVKMAEFKQGFDKIAYRGPSQSKIFESEFGLWGFHRLAIMGLNAEGMQPFVFNNSLVVCNGELYGFRNEKDKLINKGYRFESDSDCEIILPMYFEYGCEMFKRLDAEFAMVMYDANSQSYIAARDPIGIRPLFYGYCEDGSIAFASEAKALLNIAVDIKPFPPGHYYRDGKFIRYYQASKYSKFIKASIEEICLKINELLVEGVKKRLDADAPIGFLLSGGLDSSLVCAIAQREFKTPIKTFAIGMDIDAIDLKYAKQVAEYIGSEHHEVIISKKDVLECLEAVIYTLETWDITTIRASIGMYLLCKYIKENTDCKVLFTGEISDELFGYKYTDFAPDAASFQNEAIKRIDELYMYDVLRADRCISSNGLEARVAFGDLKFVDYVMGIDPEIKRNTYNMGKYLLRKAFEGDYLPKNILFRDKAAFSDAVGHSLVDDLKAYAETIYDEKKFIMGCARYSYKQPFTKEALLYRDIFTKFYPQQAALIKDYWMPNQSWPECRVNDPSARVLKNYGKSGE